jgi:hypothetical protein
METSTKTPSRSFVFFVPLWLIFGSRGRATIRSSENEPAYPPNLPDLGKPLGGRRPA